MKKNRSEAQRKGYDNEVAVNNLIAFVSAAGVGNKERLALIGYPGKELRYAIWELTKGKRAKAWSAQLNSALYKICEENLDAPEKFGLRKFDQNGDLAEWEKGSNNYVRSLRQRITRARKYDKKVAVTVSRSAQVAA